MKPSLRLTIVLVLAGCLLVPLRATKVLATLDILVLLPAWTLAARMRTSLIPTLGMSATASPVLFGAVVLVLMLMGIQAYAAAWIAFGVFALLFLAFGETRELDTNDAELRIARWLLVVAAIAGVLAFTLPLTNEWWRVREDSWFHAAVFQRVANHGVPPTDPLFAGLRLQYMYFYHALLVCVSSLSSLGPFHAMILVNSAALVGCVLGFGYLASFFSRRVWPRVLGGAFAVFGMNGLFYLFYPIHFARAFVGDTSGAAVLASFFPWSPYGHATATKLLSVENNQFFFLDKFMLGTALSLTLGLVCTLLALLISARRGLWSRMHALFFVVTVAGLLHLHAVVGVTAVGATLVVLALLLLIRSHTDGNGPSYAALTGLALVGVAIAVPYMFSLFPRGETGGASLRIALQSGQTLGILSDILPALILAIPFLRWWGKRDEWRSAGRAAPPSDGPDEAPAPPGGIVMGRLFGELSLSPSGIVAMWTLIVLVIALVVDLPTTNETKFSFPLFLPLAAFAVGGIDRLWDTRGRRALAVVLVVLSTVPLNGIYFYQAFRDASTIEFADDEMAAYRWIAHATPQDAVFIDADDIVRIPVMAGRDLYWGNETYAKVFSYPVTEMRRRREIRNAVFSEAGLTPRQLGDLRALGRPVWVLLRGVQFDTHLLFQQMRSDPLYEGRFIAGEYGVFEVDLGEVDLGEPADTTFSRDAP